MLTRWRSARPPHCPAPPHLFRSLSTDLRILYADRSICLVDKPAGLLSVPGRTPRSQLCNAHTLLAAWCLESGGGPSFPPSLSALPILNELLAVELAAASAAAPAPLYLSARRPPARSTSVRHGTLRWSTPGGAGSLLPLSIHRLDEATSGILAFAWSYPAQRALHLQLSPGGAARKTYEAVVDTRAAEADARRGGGRPVSALLRAEEGLISTPLARHAHLPLLQVAAGAAGGRGRGAWGGSSWLPGGGGGDGGDGREGCDGGDGGARACATHWRVLSRGRGAVRLELQPLTGRTHQLRLHCALPPPAGLGCAILGDPFYGDPGMAEAPYAEELLARALAEEAQEVAGARGGEEGGPPPEERSGAEGRAGSDARESGGEERGGAERGAGAPAAARARARPAVPRAAFAAAARALAAEHAARGALIRAWAEGPGGGCAAPSLPDCALLPHARTCAAPLPLPRMLLHARELRLAPRALSYAAAAATGAARAAARAQEVRALREKHGAAEARRRGEAQPPPPRAHAPGVTAALEAIAEGGGPRLWARAAPWRVAWSGANAQAQECGAHVAFVAPVPF